jgi:ring-1,2-phenylacetyl-CoA epoxidase subunit PaaC
VSWVVRLGDGTELSHRRMQAGVDRVWPYVEEPFDTAWIPPQLLADGVAVDAGQLRPEWESFLRPVLAEATLDWPDVAPRPAGGRQGVHTEAMGYLLAEMQHLHRSHPGARW